jgi:hypothetical protein
MVDTIDKQASNQLTAEETAKLKLDAILAEYNALRSEIQYRSEFQHRFVQIHIAVFTIVIPSLIAAIISPTGNQSPALQMLSTLAPWVLLIIPLESSLFGLWWLDHAITIGELGEFIMHRKERKLTTLLHDDELISWETHLRAKIATKAEKPSRQARIFRLIYYLTFIGPAAAALLATGYFIFVSIFYGRLIYTAEGLVFASIAWVLGSGLLLAYILYERGIGRRYQLSVLNAQGNTSQLASNPGNLANGSQQHDLTPD